MLYCIRAGGVEQNPAKKLAWNPPSSKGWRTQGKNPFDINDIRQVVLRATRGSRNVRYATRDDGQPHMRTCEEPSPAVPRRQARRRSDCINKTVARGVKLTFSQADRWRLLVNHNPGNRRRNGSAEPRLASTAECLSCATDHCVD